MRVTSCATTQSRPACRRMAQASTAGGTGADAYADAVATYLAFAVDRSSDYWLRRLPHGRASFIRDTFARQALPMVWDYAECHPFSVSTGNWLGAIEWITNALAALPVQAIDGSVLQLDVTASVDANGGLCNSN